MKRKQKKSKGKKVDAEQHVAEKGEDTHRGKGPAADVDAREEGGGADAPVSATVEFIPSEYFKGAKPGYVFKSDERGVGYYRDAAPAAKTAGKRTGGGDKDGGRDKKKRRKKRKSSSSGSSSSSSSSSSGS